MVNSVFPYEQLLDKKGFVAVLKSYSLNNEELENEWKRVVTVFNVNLADSFFYTLPSEEQSRLREGLDVENKSEDAEAFYKKITGFLIQESNKGLLLDLVEKSAKMAVDSYLEKFEERLRLRNG